MSTTSLRIASDESRRLRLIHYPAANNDDLHGLLGGEPSVPALAGLVDALCASDRPESIFVWKRSSKVQELLRDLGDGSIPVSHEGLDAVSSKQAEHLRALLQHHGLLPQRDPYLPRFERWIDAKLADSRTRCANPFSTSPPGTTYG